MQQSSTMAPPAQPVHAPSPALRRLVPRYAAVGALSVAIDVGSLALLHSVAHVQLLAATTIAFGISLCVNYSLNHVWAFEADGYVGRRMMRYAVLVSINYAITAILVTGLTRAGIYYLAAKAVSVALAAIVNFTGYRLWVFR